MKMELNGTASYYVLPGDDQEPLNNGLIAHYQFEENANDLTQAVFMGQKLAMYCIKIEKMKKQSNYQAEELI